MAMSQSRLEQSHRSFQCYSNFRTSENTSTEKAFVPGSRLQIQCGVAVFYASLEQRNNDLYIPILLFVNRCFRGENRQIDEWAELGAAQTIPAKMGASFSKLIKVWTIDVCEPLQISDLLFPALLVAFVGGNCYNVPKSKQVFGGSVGSLHLFSK